MARKYSAKRVERKKKMKSALKGLWKGKYGAKTRATLKEMMKVANHKAR